MKSKILKNGLTAFALFCSAVTLADTSATSDIYEVVVTAGFRATSLLKTGSSISVIDSQAIARREAKHLDQILNTVPNVNFSAGASRGRFLQIRGIGERSQFKDPLDSSVGIIIDGIDYSGIGLASALFDVQQVEVLRGPQGTQFGSSAMAGLVIIKSNQPSDEFGGQLSGGVGNYGSSNFGVVLNGALTDGLLGRIAVNRTISDGYIENDFLNRDDTNNIDENVVKAQLSWLVSDELTLGMVAHYIDADNGYNAFSLENSRDIPTDDPGHDRQKSKAVALTAEWIGHEGFDLESILTIEKSELDYGFDWDWSNLAAQGSRGKENNQRDRDAYTFDVRLVSKAGNEILGAGWVAGIYASNREVDLNYSDSWEDINDGGPWVSTFESTFESQRRAAYGQLSWALSDDVRLVSGVRFERYNNDYSDSVGVNTDQSENLWGGKITLEYTGFENSLLYASISRGYKIGGVNGQAVGKVLSDSDTPADIAEFLIARSTFDSETVINYELGLKGRYLEESLDLALSVFYMDRKDMQANAWVLFPPAEWTSYLDNVDGGYNAGIELEVNWYVSNNITLFATLGLLETELGALVVQDVDSGDALDQSGRDQAHAPNYQYNLGAKFDLTESLALSVEIDGKDEFYFSNSHNDKSDSYELLHMSLTYQVENVSVSLWGRNLTDEDYQTRGFYFDNTFPDYDGSNTRGYYQLGEPRVFGVSATYDF